MEIACSPNIVTIRVVLVCFCIQLTEIFSDPCILRLLSKLDIWLPASFSIVKVRLFERKRQSHADIKEIISIPTLLCLL